MAADGDDLSCSDEITLRLTYQRLFSVDAGDPLPFQVGNFFEPARAMRQETR